MSSNRAGDTPVYELLVGNQPNTSTITSTAPLWLKIDTIPASPTLVITMFGPVWPAAKFRFDAVGRSSPDGHTVRNDAFDASVTVTFKTTAPTLRSGTPPRPATTRSSVSSVRNLPSAV